jgi:hypothetical protein
MSMSLYSTAAVGAVLGVGIPLSVYVGFLALSIIPFFQRQ